MHNYAIVAKNGRIYKTSGLDVLGLIHQSHGEGPRGNPRLGPKFPTPVHDNLNHINPAVPRLSSTFKWLVLLKAMLREQALHCSYNVYYGLGA